MSMTTLQQLAVLPALLVALVGILALRGQGDEAKGRHLLLLLSMGALLLLALVFTRRFLTEPYDQPFFRLSTLLAPSLLAILSLVLLNVKAATYMNRRAQITAVFLVLAIVALSSLLWDSQLGMAFLILPGILIVVLGWVLLGPRQLWLAIMLSLFSLGTLLLLNRMISNPPDYTFAQNSLLLRLPLTIAFFAAPGVTVVLAGVLLTAVLQPDKAPHSWWGRLLISGLAILLLVGLAYTTFWGSVWDNTSDGLSGLMISGQAAFVAVAVGMVMTAVLQDSQRLVGLLFMVVVPVLLYQSFAWGWGASYHAITERRAAQIADALDQFHQREGYYPEALAALTPRDLLFVRQPVILVGETWCYQGGADFYRLAAFHREFFSSPVSLRVYEAAGEAPPGSWECEEELAAMKERIYSPMENPAAFRPPPPTPLPEIEVEVSKTVVQPLLNGVPVAPGSWSSDGRYFVFGAKNESLAVITLHFLHGQTGEICTVNGDFPYVETLRQHHIWLPDGEAEAVAARLLYLDANGEMTVFTPCQPEGERLTEHFPETFTQIAAVAPENGRFLLQSDTAFAILDGHTLTLQPIPDVTPNPY
ncbi:MAG TPA: hypothetical protein PLK31_15140, partial [Chloroflexota bacterium]|nr:hypothetical protein [Chloroflexota bacterium]